MNIRTTLFFSILLLFTNTLYGQQTAEIIAEKDNTIFEDADDLSNGSGEFLFTGRTASQNNNYRRRALLYFNLESEVPEEAVIERVKLSLTLSMSIVNNKPVSIHKVLKNWGEGTSDAEGQEGKGISAAQNDATWANTFFPNDTWNNAGGDFETTELSSASVGGDGTYIWESTDSFLSTVQEWLADSSQNFGIILVGDESGGISAKRFQSSENENESERPKLTVTYSAEATSIAEKDGMPDEFSLDQNYPNPFNPETVIRYSVPQSTKVELAVYDVTGREIATLVNGVKSAGSYEVVFNAENIASGVYVYTLKAEGQYLSRKLTLVK